MMCSPAHLPLCIVQQWHLVAVAGNYSNISEPASSSSRLSFNVTINLIKFLQQVQHQRLKRLLEQHINSHNKPISPSHCQDDCYPSVRQPDSHLVTVSTSCQGELYCKILINTASVLCFPQAVCFSLLLSAGPSDAHVSLSWLSRPQTDVGPGHVSPGAPLCP